MSDEQIKQSPYSPGPVADSERLLRIIFYPDHVDENDNLKPEAIPTQDLRERGFSVYRKFYIKTEKIYNVISNYTSNKHERQCRGISPIITSTVRSLRDTGNSQAFHVFDDANTKDDEAHAKIVYAQSYGRGYQKKLRNDLKDKFNSILSIETVCNEINLNKTSRKSFLDIILLFLRQLLFRK